MTARHPATMYPLGGSLGELRGIDPTVDSVILEALANRGGLTWAEVEYIASIANRIRFRATATGTSPKIYPAGDANRDLLLGGAGTGVVKVGADGAEIQVATLTGVETLTGKDLRDPSNLSLSSMYGPVRQWMKDPGGTTMQNLGFPALPTVLGTASSADVTERPLNAYTSAGAIGDRCGIEAAAFTYLRRSYLPRVRIACRTGTTNTNCRIWIGLANASLAGVGAPTTQHVAAFRYDTALDGTAFLRTVTCDGAGTPTVNPTSIAIANGTNLVCFIEPRAGDVRFWVNGTLVRTETATLPGNTTSMSPFAYIEALDAVAKNFRVGDVELLQGA